MADSSESLTGSDLAFSSEFQKGTAKYVSLFSLYILPCNISTSGNLACLLLEARNMTNIQISQWNLKHTFVILLMRTEVHALR